MTSEYVLRLAQNAEKLFESFEVHEKRLLLKITLQNLELKGKKVRYTWLNPFDKIANYSSRLLWGDVVKSVRNIIQEQKEYVYIPDLIRVF